MIHKIPTWKTLGDRGEAWVLQIAGAEWGSGSGDLRVSAKMAPPVSYVNSQVVHSTFMIKPLYPLSLA